ncbi:hypothetical protein [Limnohabitans sp.]|jgi:hypothetical protein|uniref:hypothetical protein n=1 Tax=Limnohabitans sp. TaxID=1907725 RepID=UPI00311F5FDE
MTTLTEIEAQYNDQNALDALITARKTLKSAMCELDRYISRLEGCTSPADKASVMNWALNHLACNITPNLRLDLIANAQAQYTRAAQIERSAA